jgi:hypothetical protein
VRCSLGTGAQPIVAAQIVQTAGGLKAEIDIVVPPISKHITRNVEDFCSANTVFDLYPLLRNRLIRRFFFGGQFALRRLLFRLIRPHLGWFIALKAGILPEFAPRWEVIVLVIGGALITGFARSGAAQRFDLACSAIADGYVFDGMALFFPL